MGAFRYNLTVQVEDSTQVFRQTLLKMKAILVFLVVAALTVSSSAKPNAFGFSNQPCIKTCHVRDSSGHCILDAQCCAMTNGCFQNLVNGLKGKRDPSIPGWH